MARSSTTLGEGVSTHRRHPDAGFCNQSKLPKGPNGRNLCRKCQTEVPRGRLTFCSDKCVDDWKMLSDPQHVRGLVLNRDHGICAVCGVDADSARRDVNNRMCGQVGDLAYREERKRLDAISYADTMKNHRAAEEARSKAAFQGYEKFQGLRLRRTWWEADHIIPVVEGGGGAQTLDAYQTLCVPCHKIKTSEMVSRRAKQKQL